MPLTVAEFVKRWKIASNQTERQGYQQHFLDLCELLNEPKPATADPTGESYCFERHVSKTKGGKGFADVWKRGHFAWEYKGRHKDLRGAYVQLQDYRVDLLNPPLLVVSDLDIIRVHTNFPNTQERVYEFNLDDLKNEQATARSVLPPLGILRAIFGDYNVLRPDATAARVTEEAARKFLDLAKRLEFEGRTEKPTKEEIAHFLMRIVFCLFADSIGLLPGKLFRTLVTEHRTRPRKFRRKLQDLFQAMADSSRDAYFGEHDIKYFNGGLFNDSSTIELNEGDMGILHAAAANLDWSHIEPSIFGTLFERSLDADKRSLIGAHYTSPDDIKLLTEPVIMQPLRRRWAEIKSQVEQVLQPVILSEAKDPEAHNPGADSKSFPAKTQTTTGSRSLLDQTKARARAEELISNWLDELTAVRVLDPACGSGNFLYIALRQLMDLWKESRDFAQEQGLAVVRHGGVSPRQLYGIETDFYAHEIASIVVWIGWLQWIREHGEPDPDEPILQRLNNIQHADAILRYDAEGKPYEPEWPEAEYIVGNPPFLGSRKLRAEAGGKYVDDLFTIFKGRVSQEADLVTYWFEKSLAQIVAKKTLAAGLIGTQAIRMGGSRQTLERIATSTTVFNAWSNRPWVLNGASVRISLVAFGENQLVPTLDGVPVSRILPSLTTGSDTLSARPLRENHRLAYQGPVKVGDFELDRSTGEQMLTMPVNPNGRSNGDVVTRWINARDITGRDRSMYIIDFGSSMSEAEAALYEQPFEYVRARVYPSRQKNNRERRKLYWWRHGETNLGMRRSLAGLSRYIATPRVSSHRLFVWQDMRVLPDSRVVVIAKESNYFLGVLHSTLHKCWSIANSSRHGDGDDGGRITYNIETCFDTFPFPWPPGKEPQDDPRVQAIAAAAKNLVELRDRWLNPPDIPEAELRKRTLTNLYNEMKAGKKQWLEDAHRTLDVAVFAAYGWPPDLTDQQLLERLLTLNHERAAAQIPGERTNVKPTRNRAKAHPEAHLR